MSTNPDHPTGEGLVPEITPASGPPVVDRQDRPPPVAGTVTDGDDRTTIRDVLAVVLGVLAILVLIVTTVAVWARVTVFNSDRVADIVGDALDEPEVEAALATYLTGQIFSAVDVDARVEEILPSGLQRLGPTITAGAERAVDVGLERVLATPEVQRALTEVVERAHGRAMQLLDGDGLVDGINVVDGEVTVNLLPLIARGLTLVQGLGLFDDLQVPELTADGDPAQQIAQLEAATGRDLRDDFGQLVVYQSDRLADAQASLENAQRIVVLAKRAVWILVGLTVVLFVASFLVSRNRGRAALWLGLGGIVAMILARAAVQLVVRRAPEIAATSDGRATISAIVNEASNGLLRLSSAVLIIAAVIALVALYRRHWRTADLTVVGAVLAFIAIVSVLGLSLWSLVLGVAIAILVPFAVGRFTSFGDVSPASG